MSEEKKIMMGMGSVMERSSANSNSGSSGGSQHSHQQHHNASQQVANAK
jgi:hypothetical protein